MGFPLSPPLLTRDSSFDQRQQDLTLTMKKYANNWIQDWCHEHGWTDIFMERYRYWAFPPGAVMPQPIPYDVLQAIKREQGLSPLEKRWYGGAIAISLCAGVAAYWLNSPLPLALAFIVGAISVAYLDDEVQS